MSTEGKTINSWIQFMRITCVVVGCSCTMTNRIKGKLDIHCIAHSGVVVLSMHNIIVHEPNWSVVVLLLRFPTYLHWMHGQIRAYVCTECTCFNWYTLYSLLFPGRDNHWPTILKFKIAINHGNFIYEHICKIVFVCFEWKFTSNDNNALISIGHFCIFIY